MLWVVLPLAVGGWSAVLAFIAHMGEWQALAKIYRGRPAHVMGSVSFATAAFDSGSTYGGCLTVSTSPDGVGLSVQPQFRPFHPPLLIPWEVIERCESWKALGTFDRTRLYLREPRLSLVLHGRAARLVEQAWWKTRVYDGRPRELR